MEDVSDGFEVATSEGSGAEQSPASSQGKAVQEAGDPAEKALVAEPAGTAQSEEGWDQQSPSQNSVPPENTANGTETGKEVVKMLGINVLKRYFFFNLVIAFCTPTHPHSVYACWDLVLQ